MPESPACTKQHDRSSFITQVKPKRNRGGTPAAVAARDDFAAAVSLDPADEEARFLLGLSQLMALEGETGFLNLLEEIGISPGGSLRDGGYDVGEAPDGYPELADGADTGAVFDWLSERFFRDWPS